MKTNTITKLSLALITTMALSSTTTANETSEIDALKQEIKELREMMQSFKSNQTQSASYTELKKSIKQDKEEIAELKETTQALIDETSDLKSGFNYTTVDTSKSHSGLASAASKVYYSKSPLSIGGYGEMFFESAKDTSGDSTTVDVYRFVPYIGYKFSDNIILNTEIEFEHGGVANDGGAAAGGEVKIEFMYLDFLINNNFNLRVGNMLMPMGLINERHEPTLFNTVQRPKTAKYILPTTWHESGVMAYGNITDDLSYNLAVVTSLDTGINGKAWIRDGRGGSFKNTNAGVGVVARLDYTGVEGLLIGSSLYMDQSSSKNETSTTIADIHVDYKVGPARVYGTYAEVSRSNASVIAADAATKAKGGYIALSYDLMSFTSSNKSLPLFVQYENVDPEAKKADGSATLDATKAITFGINYFPHEQVVLKLDHTIANTGNPLLSDKATSASLGFIF